MLVKHDTATSVSTDDGEIEGKSGIFDVPVELGERLIRIFGFRPHHGAAPAADAPATEKKPATRKPRSKKPAAAAEKPAETVDENAAPAADAPATE